MKKSFCILSFSVAAIYSFSQNPVGGSASLAFINNPFSARLYALGHINQTLFDNDATLGYTNPFLWNKNMHQQIAFGTSFMPGGVNAGNIAYVHHFPKVSAFGFGFNYIAYGNIPRTDESGNIIGKIQASEYIWYSGTAYHFAKLFAVGGNIKLFYSQLAEFSSVGMAADIGFSINDTAKLLSFSLTATNVGAQFKPYRNGNTEIIPFDLRMGFSFGFKGFPIRFHTTMHNLHRWNIRYSNPRENNTGNLFSSSDAKPSKDIGDEIFRHFILGAEANIKKIVRLQLAYNHLRRQEHRQLNVRSIAGFSFGMGIRIKFMDIQYAFSPYALGRNSSHLTMGIDIQKIPRRKKN